MKKISPNKIEKILRWSQVGVPQNLIAIGTKISVPTIRQIIQEANLMNNQPSESTYTRYTEKVGGQQHPVRQSKSHIQLSSAPENPSYSTNQDYYQNQWSVEYEKRVKAEWDLNLERQEHQRTKQEVIDLKQQLNKKTYEAEGFKRERDTYFEQLTKEYKKNNEWERSYNQLIEKVREDYKTFANKIETLKKDNSQLMHLLKRSQDTNYSMTASTYQSSSSQNNNSSEGKLANHELNDGGKNSKNFSKNLMNPTSETRKKNKDTELGLDYVFLGMMTLKEIASNYLRLSNTNPIRRYLPDGFTWGSLKIIPRDPTNESRE